MWTVLVIVLVVGAAVVLAVRAALVGRRPVHEPQPEVMEPGDSRDFPAPGEPTPRRSDGMPPPGSRDAQWPQR